ncbi:MAG: hypothetical protein NC453_23690, partial [Muribaculum sp.]|nr:hypothetical protein [Muribaculum sp.]
FFPPKCHDRLYCRLGGCSGLRRNIHEIKYWMNDNYWMLKDLIEQSGSSDNEVNDDIKAYIKNLKRLFLKFSIAKEVVRSKYGDNIPDQMRYDLNEIEEIIKSFVSLSHKMPGTSQL